MHLMFSFQKVLRPSTLEMFMPPLSEGGDRGTMFFSHLSWFARSEFKGQDYSESKCTCAAEAYVLTFWRRGLHVLYCIVVVVVVVEMSII